MGSSISLDPVRCMMLTPSLTPLKHHHLLQDISATALGLLFQGSRQGLNKLWHQQLQKVGMLQKQVTDREALLPIPATFIQK